MSECALQQLPHDALTLSKFCQWVVKFRYRQAYVGRNLYDSTVQCAYLSAVINITNVQICAKHLQSEYRAYFDKHLTHSMQDGSTMSHRSRISRLLSSASPTATCTSLIITSPKRSTYPYWSMTSVKSAYQEI